MKLRTNLHTDLFRHYDSIGIIVTSDFYSHEKPPHWMYEIVLADSGLCISADPRLYDYDGTYDKFKTRDEANEAGLIKAEQTAIKLRKK